MKEPLEKAQLDATILREHKLVGDVGRLATKYGVSRVYVLKLIHENRLKQEQARASEYAQSVMRAGDVVYALPANQLQTTSGANAIVIALENAIKAAGDDLNVLISVAVIPVDEIECSDSIPFERPHAVAANVQARALNRLRNSEVA